MQPLWLHRRLRATATGPSARIEETLQRLYGRTLSPFVVLAPLAAAVLTSAALVAASSWAEPSVPIRAGLAAALLGGLGAGLGGWLLAHSAGPGFATVTAPGTAVALAATATLVLAVGMGSFPSGNLLVAVAAVSALASGLCFDPAVALASGRLPAGGPVLLSSLAGGGLYGGLFGLLARGLEPGNLGVALQVGAVYAAVFAAARLRLLLYPIELLLVTSRGQAPARGRHPLLLHDLGRLPLPGLRRQILLTSETDPAAAEALLEACRRSPTHRSLPGRLLPYFQARELTALGEARRFAQMVKLRGRWLPGVEGASPWLLTFREAARYLEGAAAAPTAARRLELLVDAEGKLVAVETQLLTLPADLASALGTTLATWRQIAAGLRREAEAKSGGELPNPFRAGQPLTPEWGRELFRGRQELVGQIVSLLADAERSGSIALLGARRCGKTSLLNMLPVLLPDTLCLFFDLQDNPASSPAAFFRLLAERSGEQARQDRRLDLPLLPDGPPLEAGRRWLDQLDELGKRQPILLCIDEFERLEQLFPGDSRELRQLMGLFRGTIQHRRHLRLLIAGTAPFTELDPMWTDHFINLRELHLGHLDRETGVDLLCRPTPDFPPEVIPREVAESLFERTGGQPYLLQLYGSLLLSRLNAAGRSQAWPEDVGPVEEEVLTAAKYYLRHALQVAPPEARQALVRLARGEPFPMSRNARAWLARRSLLGEEGGLSIPVLARWIREEEVEA